MLSSLNERPILIAGVGSIGRRHLRNLRSCGWTKLHLYRSGKSTLPDLDAEIAGLPTFADLDAALHERPAAVVIATPTAAHLPIALAAARAGCHLLIEKPIADTLTGVDALVSAVQTSDVCVLIGFQYRFHPGLITIKQWIDAGAIGAITSASAQWGEYLPDWHPWEDYKQSYAARPELGGGVALTLCHPFDYLRWLLGEVTDVSAMVGRNGGLDIPVEESADVLLRFDSGAVGHVHLDYVQRPPSHTLRITGERGLILWDNADGVAKRYNPAQGVWEIVTPPDDFERNHMFLAQTQHFIACVQGTHSPRCTLHDGVRALQIALSVRDQG